MRLVNFFVVCALILAASFLYKIKFDSTLQMERVAKERGEIRRERDAIAILRAEWSKLDTPGRIQVLAQRHLHLQPTDPNQFDTLDNLPERPPVLVPAAPDDPIAAMLNANPDFTGSIAKPPAGR